MTQKTYAQMSAEIDAQLPTNATQSIAAINHRNVLHDMIDSLLFVGSGASTVSPQQFGAFADGSSHPISPTDIANHPNWIGPFLQSPHTTYPVGTEWDTVAMQEAIYACYATGSTPGNVVWNASGSRHNNRLYIPNGKYQINRQLWVSANGWNISADNRLGTRLEWQGYNRFTNVAGDQFYFTGNSHASNVIDGINATDIAQLHVGMYLMEVFLTAGGYGTIGRGTSIASINVAGGSITMQDDSGNPRIPSSPKTGITVMPYSTMWQLDSCAYGYMGNVGLYANFGLPSSGYSQTGYSNAALLAIDDTQGLLAVQQILFDNIAVYGNGNADVGISVVPISGGSGQGDTIAFINPLITGCPVAAYRSIGSNALSTMFIGGDVQACPHDGICNISGSVNVDGTSFQNQFFNTSATPVVNAAITMGASVRTDDIAGGIGNASDIKNIRDEGDVGVNSFLGTGPTVSHYGLTSLDTTATDWSATTIFPLGFTMTPTVNNTKNRTFICVNTDGLNNIWYKADPVASSGDTVVVFGTSPGWTVNSFSAGGYTVKFRFGNGFTAYDQGPITSNTANSFTITGQGLGTSANGDPTIFFMIQGHSGSVEPNWDSVADGEWALGGVISGAVSTGYATVKDSAQITTDQGLSVGNYVVIPNADLVGTPWPAASAQSRPPLIASVVSNNGAGAWGTLFTLAKTAALRVGNNASGGTGDTGYFGAPVTDGTLKWIEFPFPNFNNCSRLTDVTVNSGVVGQLKSMEGVDIGRNNTGLYGLLGGVNTFLSGGYTTGYQRQSMNLRRGPLITQDRIGIGTAATTSLTPYLQLGNTLTCTPTQNMTITVAQVDPTVGAGLSMRFLLIVHTSGTVSFTLTFTTNFRTASTLATGTVNDKYFIMEFVSVDGLTFVEKSRIGPI